MANLGYMQLVRRCNHYCRFCSNPDSAFALDPETARRQIDDFVLRGYDGVILTGGEPTLSEHVPEIARYARARGLGVRLITNGQRLADAALLESYVDAGLLHYHVSVYSVRPEVEDWLRGVKGASAAAMRALANLGAKRDRGVVADVNCVINAWNCDHLHENVAFFLDRFPFVRHFVWNNLDPSMGRAETNPDVRHRLRDMEVSLDAAMRLLERAGRTFRVERVPLCFMADFAWASTETRKIVKGEERIVHFLDEKGTVRQTDFRHAKADACGACTLDAICGGLFDLGGWYDPAELAPVFVPKEPIVARILGDKEAS